MPEPVIKTITLETPLKRGDTELNEVQIRKPSTGALRGVSLTSLVQMDVSELTKVLPRVTNPTLSDEEINNLDVVDLLKMGTEVVSFLLPKALKAESLTA